LSVIGLVCLLGVENGEDEVSTMSAPMLPKRYERIPRIFIAPRTKKDDSKKRQRQQFISYVSRNPYTIVVKMNNHPYPHEDNGGGRESFDLWISRVTAKYAEALSDIRWPQYLHSKI
jgi:hypothetical protein